MSEFDNKIAVVTGGAGALGSVVASKFVENGATTVIIDIREESVANKANELGDNCIGMVCDLTDEKAVKTTVNDIIDKYGKIDFLANIAGGFTMGGKTHETSTEVLIKMLHFNFITMYNLSRAVLAEMVKQSYGKIVNIGARAGLQGAAEMGPYVGSKSLVIRATETMAREYLENGINVNCVLPGTIDTEQNRLDMPNADTSRWVAPQQLADVILFLCSYNSIAINGAAIPVYGKGL